VSGRVADQGPDRLQPRRLARGPGERSHRGLVRLIGIDGSASRQGERKGAEPGKEVGDALGAADPLSHQGNHLALGLARGL
jgi:hypothetical protein